MQQNACFRHSHRIWSLNGLNTLIKKITAVSLFCKALQLCRQSVIDSYPNNSQYCHSCQFAWTLFERNWNPSTLWNSLLRHIFSKHFAPNFFTHLQPINNWLLSAGNLPSATFQSKSSWCSITPVHSRFLVMNVLVARWHALFSSTSLALYHLISHSTTTTLPPLLFLFSMFLPHIMWQVTSALAEKAGKGICADSCTCKSSLLVNNDLLSLTAALINVLILVLIVLHILQVMWLLSPRSKAQASGWCCMHSIFLQFSRMWRPLVSVITTRYYVATSIFHSRVWYHALSLCYACIRSSGIILIP